MIIHTLLVIRIAFEFLFLAKVSTVQNSHTQPSQKPTTLSPNQFSPISSDQYQFDMYDIDDFFQKEATVLIPPSKNIYRQISDEIHGRTYREFNQEAKIPNGLKWATTDNRIVKIYAMRDAPHVRVYTLKSLLPEIEEGVGHRIFIHLADGQLQYRLNDQPWNTNKGQQYRFSTFSLCSHSLIQNKLELRIADIPTKIMFELTFPNFEKNALPPLECWQRPTEEELDDVERYGRSYRLASDGRNARIIAINTGEDEKGQGTPIEVSVRNIEGTEIYHKLIAPRVKLRETYPDITGIRKENLTNGRDILEVVDDLEHCLYGCTIVGYNVQYMLKQYLEIDTANLTGIRELETHPTIIDRISRLLKARNICLPMSQGGRFKIMMEAMNAYPSRLPKMLSATKCSELIHNIYVSVKWDHEWKPQSPNKNLTSPVNPPEINQKYRKGIQDFPTYRTFIPSKTENFQVTIQQRKPESTTADPSTREISFRNTSLDKHPKQEVASTSKGSRHEDLRIAVGPLLGEIPEAKIKSNTPVKKEYEKEPEIPNRNSNKKRRKFSLYDLIAGRKGKEQKTEPIREVNVMRGRVSGKKIDTENNEESQTLTIPEKPRILVMAEYCSKNQIKETRFYVKAAPKRTVYSGHYVNTNPELGEYITPIFKSRSGQKRLTVPINKYVRDQLKKQCKRKVEVPDLDKEEIVDWTLVAVTDDPRRSAIDPKQKKLHGYVYQSVEGLVFEKIKFEENVDLDDDGEHECPVCDANLQQGYVKLDHKECNHRYCRSCLETWTMDNGKTTCPVCRRDAIKLKYFSQGICNRTVELSPNTSYDLEIRPQPWTAPRNRLNRRLDPTRSSDNNNLTNGSSTANTGASEFAVQGGEML